MDFQEESVVEINKENKTLIDDFEEEYRLALKSIDTDVKELIESRKIMRGLLLFGKNLSSIVEIHESLHILFSIIYNNQLVLNVFNPKILMQLGHELKPTVKLLNWEDSSVQVKENYIVDELKSIGYSKTHWYIKNSLLVEIEYMIDVLRELVESDFIPLDDTEDISVENKPDRHIHSSVKLAVWRRDRGKCVECGSKEKLEYDHIIPISKGGSNTVRNIQLLCEKCNRQKSANIQ